MLEQIDADLAWLDYKHIILNLLESVYYIRGNIEDEVSHEIFPTTKKAIEEAKSPSYSDALRSLEHVYGFNPDYKKLAKITKQIEAGGLDPSEKELAEMFKEAESYRHIFLQNKGPIGSFYASPH